MILFEIPMNERYSFGNNKNTKMNEKNNKKVKNFGWIMKGLWD